jgi:CheY-like chemotaxis protein
LLLANSAHEVRTPLNAIINYLEIAMEGSLDKETRDNLSKSHSASKSLIYVINDLLDLTKTEEGGELTKDEIFDIRDVLREATEMFSGDARRKNISYDVTGHEDLPLQVVGDARRVRQAISNVTANAIQNTTEGGVSVNMCVASRDGDKVEIEICVSDTGAGMDSKKLDALFRELEQVQSDNEVDITVDGLTGSQASISESSKNEEGRTLGLGLAVVSRILRNMNGQLRLKSEEGKGSRFVLIFPLDLPEPGLGQGAIEDDSMKSGGSTTPLAERPTQTPSTPSNATEETVLVERGSNQDPSTDGRGLARQSSNESFGSRRSMRSGKSGRSNKSTASAGSNNSQAERLIRAIQEPHGVDGWTGPGTRRSSIKSSTPAPRPRLDQRHATFAHNFGESTGSPSKPHRSRSIESAPEPGKLVELRSSAKPGTFPVKDQGVPINAVRVPDELGSPAPVDQPTSVPRELDNAKDMPDDSNEPPTADHMRVLVAEDDPVNSRIIKKRLEKLGHEVYLTVNGEECAAAYAEKTGYFDIVLMDIQVCMPLCCSSSIANLARRCPSLTG